MSTKAELRHLNRLAGIGCILCKSLGLGETPAEMHHLRTGQGMSQRAPHWLAIPLCAEHHRGSTGLHGMGTRAFERHYGLSELDMLALTIEALQ